MKKYRWIIFGLSILLFTVIAYLVSKNMTTSLDLNIYKVITFSKSNFITSFLKFITIFAGEYIVISIIILSFIFIKNKKISLCIFIDGTLIVLINYIIKHIFMRDRPFNLMIIKESGFSFPSGHAMVSLGLYGFFIYLICKSNIEKKYKIIITSLLIILILLIGISRIYLGVHFPTDVIAGYMISLALLSLYTYILEKRNILWFY